MSCPRKPTEKKPVKKTEGDGGSSGSGVGSIRRQIKPPAVFELGGIFKKGKAKERGRCR